MDILYKTNVIYVLPFTCVNSVKALYVNRIIWKNKALDISYKPNFDFFKIP